MENYFNYFTEIEERFQQCRAKYWREASPLLSTLDWALIESWKEAGISLPAVILGIERSFEKFTKRPNRFRKINGLAYCSQAVLEAAEEMNTVEAASASPSGNARTAATLFTGDEITGYFKRNTSALEDAARQALSNQQQVLGEDLSRAARTLSELSARNCEKGGTDCEELERYLSALEEQLTASLTRASSLELLTHFRSEVEQGLAGSRRKMSASQFENLERQFTKKRLFEHYRIPRLSLFYL